MKAAFFQANLRPCIGLIVAPVIWAVNTQLGQMLPSVECRAGWPVLAATSAVGVLIALGAAFLSWNGPCGLQPLARQQSIFPTAFDFVAMLSTLSGVTFAFVLALQGFASLMLLACER